MPATFTPGDEKQEERLNPDQQYYDRRFRDIANAEEAGTFNDIVNHNDANTGNEPGADAAKVHQDESEGTKVPPGGWESKVTGGKNTGNPKLDRALKFAKKRGGIIGLIALFGVGGGILAGILGPASMLINIAENITTSNDSSSTSLERRFLKQLAFSTAPTDPVCANSSKLIKCKMGRISNSALNQLQKKGITPYFDADATNTTAKTGYPSKNPKGYTIDTGDARGKINVNAPDLTGFLSKEPKIAAKVLGVGGAFNLQLKSWTGKYITDKFFKTFGLSRDGGLADGKGKGTTIEEKLNDIRDRLKSKLPGLEKLNGATDAIKAKVSDNLGKVSKGGAAYMTAVAACIAVKAPSYIAAGVGAVELAQILPVINDVILSPASKLKASGVDTANAMSPQDADTINSLLTDTTARASDGKQTSSLDSPYLQSAMGVNQNKVPISTDFTPGFSILTNPVIVAAHNVQDASKPACNALMSPASMYSAMAVDAAATVASSATIIGGIAKIVASFAVSTAVQEIATAIVGAAAQGIIQSVASGYNITSAKGQSFGDVLGISAASFFSAGGMAHNLPTLKMSQLGQYTAIQQENNQFNQQMAVASLSPFDTSSKYTFLGSIVHNIQDAAVANGAYGNIGSMLSGIAAMPFKLLTNTASADTNLNATTCGYASSFGLDATNSADTPAINMAGLPCTGMTKNQDNMSSDEAMSLIENEGWLDETVDVPSSANISDLLQSGYIKSGTPLSDFIESCSSAATGDYIFNAQSCTVNSTTASTNTVTSQLAQNTSNCQSSNGKTSCLSTGDSSSLPDVKDPRSLEAIVPFLIDYQDHQVTNGEDVDNGSSSSVASAQVDDSQLFNDSTSVACAPGTQDAGTDTGYHKGTAIPVRLCKLPNTTLTDGQSGPGLVNSRASAVAFAMFDQMKKDLGLNTITLNDSFRTMAMQQQEYARYGSPQAAQPGYSNHQMGYAFDINMGSANGGNSSGYTAGVNTSYPGNRVWEWLKANASKFHYSQLSSEGWHWSINGE